MEIRTAEEKDLDAVAAAEAESFPPEEAADKAAFRERIRVYGDHFLLLFDGDKLAAFIDGFVTNQPDLTDEMYERADMHDENGGWQMIFGVVTVPSERSKGYAGTLIREFIRLAGAQGRKGLVLTCKERLIGFYEQFGFADEGITDRSVHGGVSWHQMRLVLPKTNKL